MRVARVCRYSAAFLMQPHALAAAPAPAAIGATSASSKQLQANILGFRNNSSAGPAVLARRGYAAAKGVKKGSARQTKAQAAAMDISQ